jgi:hypothetical protein
MSQYDWFLELGHLSLRVWPCDPTGLGQNLMDSCRLRTVSVVRRRLYQAGVRLAMVLGGVWPKE